MFKATLSSGIEVAVKKMNLESLDKNYDHHLNSFLTELKVMHGYPCQYILSLMAVSFTTQLIQGSKRFEEFCLISEFMTNGSLQDRLLRRDRFGNLTKSLSW